jgi:type I restriction enzyme S subunit
MNIRWPFVKLAEVLTQYKEYIDAPEPQEYPKLSVKLYGRGVVLDTPANGATLKMMRHQIAKAGQVILSEIWGKKGAIGFVPAEGEGALCTSHFFLFDINPDKLDRGWLRAFFAANYLQGQLDAEAKGTTGYAAVRPKTLLNCEIPLPPLSEQRRIVARIEELAAKINEARRLRQKSIEECGRLLVCMAHRNDLVEAEKTQQGWRRVRLADVMEEVDDSHPVQADASYPNFGIYSFGRGLFQKPNIDGALTSAKTLRRVRKGQFIYSRLFAFEGAYGFVTNDFDGHFVSNEYPAFDCRPDQARAEFIAAYFKSPVVWKDVATGSTGLGDRRQRVQPDKILSYSVWLPPIEMAESYCRCAEADGCATHR